MCPVCKFTNEKYVSGENESNETEDCSETQGSAKYLRNADHF